MSREERGRVQVDGIHALVGQARRDDGADLDAVRTQGQPDERGRAPVADEARAEIEQLADDRRVDERASGLELVAREQRALGGLGAPRRELRRPAEIVPEDDLARLHRKDLGQRRCRDLRDLVRVAEAAEVHEQPREGGKVELPAPPERLGQRGEREGQRLEQRRGVLRQRALGLEVQCADDQLPEAQRERELAPDAGKCRDVVGIRPDVVGSLW